MFIGHRVGGGASGAGVGTPHFTSIWLKAYAAGDVGKVITLCAYDGGAPFVSPLLNVTLTANWVRYFVSSPAPVWAIEITPRLFPHGLFCTAGAQTGQTQVSGLGWPGRGRAPSSPPTFSTTTAAVTRAADNVSMTGTNFSSWYNQSKGTLVFEFAPTRWGVRHRDLSLASAPYLSPDRCEHMRAYYYVEGYAGMEAVNDGAYVR